MLPKETQLVHAALILIQVFFATLAIAAKIALRELAPAALVLLRVAGAALAFGLILRGARVSAGVQRRRDYARLALYALLGVVFNQLLYVQGLAYTTAINANILITTIPAFTLGVALLLRQERATPAGVAGLLLALLGALTLIGPGRFEPSHTLGNTLVVLNALSYSVYLVLSKDLLRRYPPLAVSAWVFAFGVLGVLPFGLPELLAADLGGVSGTTWLAVLYIIFVPTAAAYWLSLWALQRAESSVVAIYIYMQPLVTVLIAPAVLGERLGVEAVLAGVFIFAGIALVIWSRRPRPVREAVRETRV